jgi:hypothetical protein
LKAETDFDLDPAIHISAQPEADIALTLIRYVEP